MKKNISSGQGILYSIFEGGKLKKRDLTGINGYINDRKNGLGRFESYKNNLNSCSVAAQNYIKNAEKAGKSTDEIAKEFAAANKSGSKFKSTMMNIASSLGNSIAGMGISLVISTAINASISSLNNLVNAYQNNIKKLSEYKDEIKSLQQEHDSLNNEIKVTNEKIKELEALSNNDLTLYDESELQRLRDYNDELERNLRINEANMLLAEKNSNDAAKKMYNNSQLGINMPDYQWYDVVLSVLNPVGYTLGRLGASNISNLVQGNTWDQQMDFLNKAEEAQKKYEESVTEFEKFVSEHDVENLAGEQQAKYNELLANKTNFENDFNNNYLANLSTRYAEWQLELNLLNPDDINNQDRIKVLQDAIDRADELLSKQKDKKYFTDVYNSTEFSSVTDELEKLAKAGKLTEDTFNNVDGIEAFVDAVKEVCGEGTTAETIIAAVEKYVEALGESADGTSGSLKTLAERLSEVADSASGIVDNTKIIQDAMSKMTSGETLSFDEVTKLLEIDPSLADDFTRTADGYKIATDTLLEARNKYIEANKDEIESKLETAKADAKSYEDEIKKYEKNKGNYERRLSKEEPNSKFREQYQKIIKDYEAKIDLAKSNLEDSVSLVSAIELILNQITNPFDDQAELLSNIIDKWANLSDLLNDTTTEVEENGNISLDTLKKISSTYPQLENDVSNYLMGLTDEQTLLAKLNKAYEDSLYEDRYAVAQKIKLTDEELQSYLDALNTKYAADENYYANLGALGENFINYMKDNYDIDLQNCKTWNDAKLKMQQETMAKLTALAGGINIKDYYDFETGKKIGNWSDLYSNAGLVNSGVLSQLVNILSDYGDGIQEFGKLFKSANTINGATGKSPSSAKDTTSSFFDWIQVKLDKLKTITSNFIDSITDTISKKQSESYLNSAIKSVRNEKKANQKAIETYTAEANKIGLSDEWKRKIQNGDYSLDEVKDPDLAKKIQDYQELWDKIKGCKQNVKDLTKAEQEYITQREDLNIDAYEYDVGRKQYRRNQYENVITRKNLEGKKVTAQDYKRTNAAIERENKSLMESIAYKTQIQSQYDPTSKRYQELQESIDADKQSIEDNTNAILGNTQKMSEIKIEDIQRKADSYGRKVQIKQNQIDLREAQGYKVGASAYQYMIDYTEAENETLRKQRDEIKKLQAETEVGSEKWNEYQDQLEGINDTIYSNRIQQAEWNAQIRDMPIEKLQSYLDLVDSIKSTVRSEVEMMEYIYGESSIKANNILKQQYSQKDLDTQWDIVNEANKLYADAKRDGRAEDMEKYQKMANEAEQSYYDMLKTNEELFRRARDITLYRGYEQDLQHIEDIKKALNSLEDMLNDDALFNDDGSFSNQGIAKVALTVNQLEQARASAANYQKQIDKLYANRNQYKSEDEFNEKLRELTDGYQSATAEVNQYTEAIKDLYKNQAQEELNVLNELIDARSEAIEKKKSYYDYDRTIRNKTKDITAMQMQIEALNGVSTAEAKAQKALLQEQLNGLEEDLADTQAEHIYQVQIDGLNEQKEILQDIYDTFIDSLNKCLDTEQEIISSATYLAVNSVQTVQSLLYDIAKARGYTIDPVYMSNNNTLPHFANGGLVESKGKDDGLAWLKAGEYVLNENAFKAFKYTLPIIDNLADKMHTMIKSMDSAEKPVSIGDVQLIVQGNVDKDVMTDLKKYQKQITDSVITSITKDLIKAGYKR